MTDKRQLSWLVYKRTKNKTLSKVNYFWSITTAQCQDFQSIPNKYKFILQPEPMAVLKKLQQLREDLACEQVEESNEAIINPQKENPDIGELEKIHLP